MKGELVFVPLIGSVRVEGGRWDIVPHRKAWGLLDDDSLHLLYCERADGSLSIHHEEASSLRLFESELELVERNPTTVPAIVSQRLAVLALAPDKLGATN